MINISFLKEETKLNFEKLSKKELKEFCKI